jgi:hypothetical protein
MAIPKGQCYSYAACTSLPLSRAFSLWRPTTPFPTIHSCCEKPSFLTRPAARTGDRCNVTDQDRRYRLMRQDRSPHRPAYGDPQRISFVVRTAAQSVAREFNQGCSGIPDVFGCASAVAVSARVLMGIVSAHLLSLGEMTSTLRSGRVLSQVVRSPRVRRTSTEATCLKHHADSPSGLRVFLITEARIADALDVLQTGASKRSAR